MYAVRNELKKKLGPQGSTHDRFSTTYLTVYQLANPHEAKGFPDNDAAREEWFREKLYDTLNGRENADWWPYLGATEAPAGAPVSGDLKTPQFRVHEAVLTNYFQVCSTHSTRTSCMLHLLVASACLACLACVGGLLTH